jgi:hypothetical protein
VYGRALLRETGRPQGMVESCWGGTSIESWSSAETLARCSGTTTIATSNTQHTSSALTAAATAPTTGTKQSASTAAAAAAAATATASMFPETPAEYGMHPPYQNHVGSGNYNGMISPLLSSPIKGVIWYQGEANAGRYNNYTCQMRAMIEGWRGAWLNPPALKNFTFVLHQLSACTYGGDVPALRWSQQGAVQSWSGLSNVAMSVGLDLYDEQSPCANVHIRNKSAVGERMALAGLALAYNKSVAYTGPVASTFAIKGDTLTVGFVGAIPPLTFKSIANQTMQPLVQGVEVLVGGVWQQAAATPMGIGAAITVKLPSSGGDGNDSDNGGGAVVEAVRYAWASIPTSQLLFDSAPGGLDLYGLPAAPFWANCSATGACTLLLPGSVPGEPNASPLGPYVPSPSPSPPGPAPAPPSPHPPVPPSPGPPQCPRHDDRFPASGTTACSYTNNTAFAATPYATVDVPLNAYAACCAACKSDPKCAAAQLYHGPETRSAVDWCQKFDGSKLQRRRKTSVCPSLNVVIV